MREARPGKPHTAEAKRKMSESHKRLGTHPPTVRLFTPEEEALLGTMLDKDVAAKTGRSFASIVGRRALLGIESFRKRTRSNGRPRKPFSPDEDALLGTLPDQEVADRLNRGLDGVRERRIALGIGTFRSRIQTK